MAEQHDLMAASGGRGPAGRSPPTPAPDCASANGGDELTVEQILAWADAHHAAHGVWPAVGPGMVSGIVSGTRGESWKAINHALVFGLRGLPGDSSLAELLAAHRGAPLPDMGPKALAEKIWAWEQEQFPVKRPRLQLKRSAAPQYRLTIEQILAWADAHHTATGNWPRAKPEPVHDAPYDATWSSIDMALRQGHRGLAAGSSLARLLAEHRGVPNQSDRPGLTVEQILAWADDHHAATGEWPTDRSGPVAAAPGENWYAIQAALNSGYRGLSGGMTLPRLLADRLPPPKPQLTLELIRTWAEGHEKATGIWPDTGAGPVAGVPGETWCNINKCLRRGRRGLPGGMSLKRVLGRRRNPVIHRKHSKLTVTQILAWADAHHAATGKWPNQYSGPIPEAPGERWMEIDAALNTGGRGLPGRSTLRKLLQRFRGPGASTGGPAVQDDGRVAAAPTERALTVEQILAWADAHHAAHGQWPGVSPGKGSGEVAGAPGESWKAINYALAIGLRGLPGDSSLAELLAEHRGTPLPDMGPRALADKIWAWEQEQFPVKKPRKARTRTSRLPALTKEEILAWADAHHAATGKWPSADSGRVHAAPLEMTWSSVNKALYFGRRGFPGGASLHLLLAEHRVLREPLSVEQILAWADAYEAAHGRWPRGNEQPQEAGPGVSWHMIDEALRKGQRGFPGGSGLLKLLIEHRGPDASRRPPPLTEEQILAWADAQHAVTGKWPTCNSGAILQAPDESWLKMDLALRQGHRGLSGGVSLARLLAQHRGVKNRLDVARLSVEQILAWADAHHAATGRWPSRTSGIVSAALEETWVKLDAAMRQGIRGLGVKTSLARILAEHRGVPNPADPPRLTIAAIIAWADAHYRATGSWPNPNSGRVTAAPENTWRSIATALKAGSRNLPAGLTIHKLLANRKPPLP